MRYPAPLKPGATIAISAISSGVDAPLHPRLDKILQQLRERGFNIIEGANLRNNTGYVSASSKARAEEFMAFATDPEIAAIIPPYGGELAIEILPLIDFDKLTSLPPKWIVGYSDISTLTTAITTRCNWATVHSACLMELLSEQPDPLTNATLSHLEQEEMANFTQLASHHYQNYFPDWQKNPYCVFDLQQPTQWQNLKTNSLQIGTQTIMRGRLIGGCLDTLVHLFGTPYFDLEAFKKQYQSDGVILYLENVELSLMSLKRALCSMEFKQVFTGLNGLILGRSSGPADPKGAVNYQQIIGDFFKDKDFPVIFDADIGHFPPNMTLVNGSLANVSLSPESGNGGTVIQSLVP